MAIANPVHDHEPAIACTHLTATGVLAPISGIRKCVGAIRSFTDFFENCVRRRRVLIGNVCVNHSYVAGRLAGPFDAHSDPGAGNS